MNSQSSLDPFKVLGVSTEATEAEIRARYLELVKQFPPERDPAKFRELHEAFQAANDPLVIARQLLVPPSDEPPEWSDALEAQKRNPPALNPRLLLSLGNRDDSSSPQAANSESSGDEKDAGDSSTKQHFIDQPHE